MRTEKFAYQGHVLFESHTVNQVARMLKVHYPDIGLLGSNFAYQWLRAWRWKSPGMLHDQSRAGHPLQQLIRLVPVNAGPEFHTVPGQIEIEQRVALDHRHILIFRPD